MKWTPLLLLTTLLSACGGSDSETVDNPTSPTPPPPTAPVPQIEVAPELEVATTGTLTVIPAISTADDVEVTDVRWSQVAGETLEIITADNSSLVVRAPDIDNTTTTSWEISVSDSNGKTSKSLFDIVVRTSIYNTTPVSQTVDTQNLHVEVNNFDTTPQDEIALVYAAEGAIEISIITLHDNKIVEKARFENAPVETWFFADVLSKGYRQLLLSSEARSETSGVYYTIIDDISGMQAEFSTNLDVRGKYYSARDISGDGINEIYHSEIGHNSDIEYWCKVPMFENSVLSCEFERIFEWVPDESNGYLTPLDSKLNLDNDAALESIYETFEAQCNIDCSEYEYVITGIEIAKQTSPFFWQAIGEIPLGSLSDNTKYAVTDLNSDGLNDILRLTTKPIDLFLNTGSLSTNFADSVPVEGSLCQSFSNTLKIFENIDIDDDGHQDIFCSNGSWTKVTPDGESNMLITAPLPFAEGTSIFDAYLSDFDGDGDRDIVYRANENKKQRWVAVNTGAGFATSPLLEAINGGAYYRDFDGDGDLDALLIEKDKGAGKTSINIYRNLLVNKG